ncbi:MAG: hypothetical protein ABI056_02970 [Caulobacteraceae bacterium]
MSRLWVVAGGLAAVLALDVGGAMSQSSAAAPETAPIVVPLDSEATVGGLRVACTGVGQSKDDPRWKAYPIRIEFSNPAGDLLANGAIKVSNPAGAVLASVSCEGPWILLRPAGVVTGAKAAYRVAGWLPGKGYPSQTATFVTPASGQRIVDLRFPDA